jgi:hypothetical protein
MPSWNDLLNEFTAQPDSNKKAEWLADKTNHYMGLLGQRLNRNVLAYGSAWLQKPQVPSYFLQITHEDVNGFMSTIYGMDWSKGLALILHTPGGVTVATQTIVDYLRAKFPSLQVIVPVYAMSAGTMISLAASEIVMGKQSQLGPIDPQLPMMNRTVSAQAILEQFKMAKGEIQQDVRMAHAWAPILQSYGPSLLVEAKNAMQYGEDMVRGWLEQYMFATDPKGKKKAKAAAHHFNDASGHKSHGRRIDRDEARSLGLNILDLERDQNLQDEVLTVYHLMTIMFEVTPSVKLMTTHHGRRWIKNMQVNQP